MNNSTLKTLLVPIAENQVVSPRFNSVFGLAELHGARVVLAMVVEDLGHLAKQIAQAKNHELALFAESQCQHKLTNLSLALREDYPELAIETVVLRGKAFIQLIELAREINADVIALDSLHDSIKSDVAFGSTVKHLIRKSDVPIWAVSHQQPRAIRHVVAALDVSSDDPEITAFNEKILLHAVSLAGFYGARLSLLHAWRLFGENYLRVFQERNNLDVALISRDLREQRKARLQRLAEQWVPGDFDYELALIEGRAEAVIPEYAHVNHSDLVVMGTVNRINLPGFFIGNTAESMLDTLHCSVLTLKPDGFHSPVSRVETLA